MYFRGGSGSSTYCMGTPKQTANQSLLKVIEQEELGGEGVMDPLGS